MGSSEPHVDLDVGAEARKERRVKPGQEEIGVCEISNATAPISAIPNSRVIQGMHSHLTRICALMRNNYGIVARIEAHIP